MNLNKVASSIISKWNEIKYHGKNPNHFICEGNGKPVLNDSDKELAISLGASENDFPILCLILSNKVKRGMK